jgi:hypothetical protein
MTESPSVALPAPVSRTGRDLGPAVVVLLYLPVLLLADTHVGLGGQVALGALTWVLLLALLRPESAHTRAQVAVVVVFATIIEYTFAGWLEVYVYRLRNVPAFVPPGHGLVYLASLCIGRSALARSAGRTLIGGMLLVGGTWALWGITFSQRLDVLGAVWFGCLLGFLVLGRQPLVYVGAFLVVSPLEILGTGLGIWTWQITDPLLGLSMGNPPSGVAGGYGWFDAAGIALAPTVVRWFRTRGERRRVLQM